MSEKKESAEIAEVETKTAKTHYDMKMEQRAKAKKREARELRAWKIAGCVIVIAIIAFILSFPIRHFLEVNETVCVIGGREVKRVEFDYNYQMVKNSYLNNYGSLLSYYGMSAADIENEMYDATLTFRDYFEKETVERIKQTVVLSQEIAREGYTSDIESDYEDYIESMKEGAAAQGVSLGQYYKDSLGQFATQRNLEKYVRESLLVAHFSDDKQNSFAPTDEEISARYSEDADDYDLFDYYLTTINAELPTAPTELADEGATVADDGSYTPSEAETEAAMQDAKTKADAAEAKVFTDGEFHEGETSSVITYQIKNWLLDASRKDGDTTSIEASAANCYYVVGFKKRYMDEESTINLRVIVTSEDNGAQILSEFAEAGSTEEAFIALVDKYSEAGSTNGGLIEGINGVDLIGDLNEWSEDASRQPGDVKYAFDEASSISYICYYLGGGEPSWYYSIKNLMSSEKMDDYLAGLTANVTVEDPKGNLEYIALEAAAELLQQNVEDTSAVPAE